MVITFCGHAIFTTTEEQEQKMLAFLETTVGNQAADMYFGGYGEFDEFAYRCCKEYKKTHPNVYLFFITPYITENYQKKHLFFQKEKYDGIIYPEIENKPLKFAIFYRNKWMVEKADYVITFVNHDWGGAYIAYRYAKQKGKPIFNLGTL